MACIVNLLTNPKKPNKTDKIVRDVFFSSKMPIAYEEIRILQIDDFKAPSTQRA